MRLDKAFDKKKVICEPSKIISRISELEVEWLSLLLIRAGVPKLMIDRVKMDVGNSASEWPQYLLYNHKIIIEKNVKDQSVDVYIVDENNKNKIANWNMPESVKVISADDRITYELHLRYWQAL